VYSNTRLRPAWAPDRGKNGQDRRGRIAWTRPSRSTPVLVGVPARGETDGSARPTPTPDRRRRARRRIPLEQGGGHQRARSGMHGKRFRCACPWGYLLFGGDILSDESLLAMTDVGTDGYGLGTFDQTELADGFDVPAIGNGGWDVEGYSMVLSVLPSEGRAISVLTNVAGDPKALVMPVAQRLASALQDSGRTAPIHEPVTGASEGRTCASGVASPWGPWQMCPAPDRLCPRSCRDAAYHPPACRPTSGQHGALF
jgi:hypothetical protein